MKVGVEIAKGPHSDEGACAQLKGAFRCTVGERVAIGECVDEGGFR